MSASPRTRPEQRTARAANSNCGPAKVLTISTAGEIGGAERSLLEVARALNKERIDLQACVPPNSALAVDFKKSGVTAHEIALGRIRRTLNPLALARQLRVLRKDSREIASICENAKITVLHANSTPAAMLAWEVSRLAKMPFVWHCRDIVPMHGLATVLSAKAAAVVAISAAVQTHLLKESVPARKITRIENGIDLSRFATGGRSRARARKDLNISPDQPVLLSIGAFVPWKKHEMFLETIAALKQKRSGIIGLLAGSDLFGQNAKYVQKLKHRAAELALTTENLRWLGERDDIPELLSAADVLVSCSENEPFGRVIAEAGAAGLPVVSTNSGAKAEIIEQNVSGILTPQDDVQPMADACSKLLENRQTREKMGAAARERVEQLFDVRRTANELSLLLESVAVHGT